MATGTLLILAVAFLMTADFSDFASIPNRCDCSKDLTICDSLAFNDCPLESGVEEDITLDTLFQNMEKESSSFVLMSEMKESAHFRMLYDHPQRFQKAILAYIRDTTRSLTHRVWAIESQTACDDLYFAFATGVVELYKDGKIEERLMDHLLIPTVNRHLPFVRNFNNARFKKLLHDLKSSPTTSDNLKKGLIRDLLSGYVCDHWESYR
jgi:hypothetical protein